MKRGRPAALLAGAIGATALLTAALAGGGQAASASVAAVAGRPVTAALTSFKPPGAHHPRNLIFKAAFPGKRLNRKIWATCYSWTWHGGCTNFGNTEFEWYTPSQVRVRGGVLHLVAQRKPVTGVNKHGKRKKYYCKSGMVTTLPGFSFKYGTIEVVARIPYGQNLWSAIWLVAANGQWPPEIDMLEHWDMSKLYSFYFHPVHASQVHAQRATPNLSKGWHVIGLYWTKKVLVWYIGGHRILTIRKHVPHQRMYLIANVAANLRPRKFGGCDNQMLIKSVKVWRP